MSLVGPRPQVMRDVNLYTEEEYRLFDAWPGITDFSSIVFDDEGDILRGSENPDLKYNQVIRPWKSRLGAVDYLDAGGRGFPSGGACAGVQTLSRRLGAPEQLVEVAGRAQPLVAYPPPGATQVETRW